MLNLSTVADAQISNPPWVKFQSAGWVNFPSAPTAIRKNGISSDHCEHIEGITTTTVALDTVLGRFAISMPIPTFRFERKRDNYIEELLRRKAGLLKEIGIDG